MHQSFFRMMIINRDDMFVIMVSLIPGDHTESLGMIMRVGL
jgi:hypothetical protein